MSAGPPCARDYLARLLRHAHVRRPSPPPSPLPRSATNETHTVREFVEKAFAVVGTTVTWTGAGVEEKGVDAADPTRVLVSIDPAYFRPTEVDLLLGDASKAKAELGWAASTKFEALVKEMVLADLALVDKGDLIN